MKTIILPGFSVHNRRWAEEIKNKVRLDHPIEIIHWEHWSKAGGLKLKQEKAKILKIAGKEKINIIAKSVGTRVVMAILPLLSEQIEKIILCGIPSASVEFKKAFSLSLKGFDSKKIFCLQNKKDPFASYLEIKRFMGDVNSKIKVVEKERSDHQYPYFEDFQKFLN